MAKDPIWWKHAVFYQIYPRSFMDANGDGVGDLQGIVDRLDYLMDLGVDAVWLSPIYASPMVDYGYDVADHTAIHPVFGDMETFDRLLHAAHQRNIRVVLDYIPNHTSDQHPWFLESRQSRNNPRGDWYVWKDPKPDVSPPNNWESMFGGSAWEWDENRGQYYLHLFLKEQPDLNWRNPEVVDAMHDVLRFWLDKGVDGFRVDAVMGCIKDANFRDNPPVRNDSPLKTWGLTQEPVFTSNQPEIHELVRGLRSVLDSYDGDRVMIGETWAFDPNVLTSYYGKKLNEFHIPFNFTAAVSRWNAEEMRRTISSYHDSIPEGAMPNFVFGNHDISRVATRFGPENHRSAGALLLTLWGVPTLYYGDELGMENVHVPVDLRKDPLEKGRPGLNLGRDPERTPMPWNDSPNAGFSPQGTQTWLPVSSDYRKVNVGYQRGDPASTLNFYRSLLGLRKQMPALSHGDFAFVEEVPSEAMAYLRTSDEQRVLVIINFGSSYFRLDLSIVSQSGKRLLSSRFSPPAKVDLSDLKVYPHESLIMELT